ncbi:MAG: radical SAM family heme chaperone HemW, partial [Betaproteobacteria bacterium]|nr:radical SAM family heme chaperone HemW [Betaproteobacteria bacterium]
MSAVPMSMPGRPSPPPLGIYVHFPWCVRRCPYCDFNAHQLTGQLPEADYAQALRADLEASAARVWERSVASVYLGGGTPSLFSPQSVERLLSDIRMLCSLQPDAEITMEVNPGTESGARLDDYVKAGVNRFSIGVQSLSDQHLRLLGRIHDAAAATTTVTAACATGARVNCDLMVALPGQSPVAAADQVAELAEFGCEHLSIYRLTLEPGTPFYRNPPAGMPDEDSAADILDCAAAAAAAAGYQRYEVSAYAAGSSARSRHNLNYWLFGDYLGIGAGAHSKLTDGRGVLRSMRHKSPRRYLAAAPSGEFVASSQRINCAQLAFEFMFNALRLKEGFAV